MTTGRSSGLRLAGSARFVERTVDADQWAHLAHDLYKDAWWLEAIWSTTEPDPEVRGLWGRRGEFQLLRMEVAGGSFPSLTNLIPASDWFERAIRDRTGLIPAGHVDPRPFLFHEAYPNGHVEGRAIEPAGDSGASFPFVHHEGPGVFEIPVGPIHAGIIEPGHFRFTTPGEIILDLEVRLNYAHKGTLALARGKSIEHALRLLERLSGDNAASHACAFAAACEAALGTPVPGSLQRIRCILVELERLYNHCGDLGGIATDVALPAAASHFLALKEQLMRWNQRLFGHRLLMNVVKHGGLHHAPVVADWRAFDIGLPAIRRQYENAVAMTANHSGLKERVEGTGHLSKATAELLSCVGPAARASGVARDARTDAPCMAYPVHPIEAVVKDRGTVSSRGPESLPRNTR